MIHKTNPKRHSLLPSSIFSCWLASYLPFLWRSFSTLESRTFMFWMIKISENLEKSTAFFVKNMCWKLCFIAINAVLASTKDIIIACFFRNAWAESFKLMLLSSFYFLLDSLVWRYSSRWFCIYFDLFNTINETNKKTFMKSNSCYLIKLWGLTGFISQSGWENSGLFGWAFLGWPELFGSKVHCSFVVLFLCLWFLISQFSKNLVVCVISSHFVIFLAVNFLQFFNTVVGLICYILAVSQWGGFHGGGVFKF